MNLMDGKKGVITGIANSRSIAFGIATELAKHGAEIAVAYNPTFEKSLDKRIKPLAEKIGSTLLIPMDGSDDESIQQAFATVKKEFGSIDFLVHSMAYAPKESLQGNYYEVTRKDFASSMDISVYSFTAMARYCSDILNQGASLLTLSYYGAEKTLPNYNMMGVAKAALEASVRYLADDFGSRGIRVNAISAGTIKTLAASGIGDFSYMLNWNEKTSLLKRTVTTEEVGKSALYLLSDLSSGVTGSLHYVDAGYNVQGMPSIEVQKNLKQE